MAANWGTGRNPREILEGLRNPTGDIALLFDENFVEDNRREVVYGAIIEMAAQATSRHIERAMIAYKALNNEKIDAKVLAEYGFNGLKYEDYFRVIPSNFYSALTHLTDVILELRMKPDNAVAGVLELLVDGQKKANKESLRSALDYVDKTACIIFEYEKSFFKSNDFVSNAVSLGYCNGENRFEFQKPVEEATIHPHWGPEANFYMHHIGQWNEVNVARAEFEPACKALGIDMNRYANIQELYRRFENLG